MAIQKKVIGKLPVPRGEYQEGTSYGELNLVTRYGSTYMSKHDNNTTAPATLSEEGKVVVNTNDWEVFSDSSGAYEADKKLTELEGKLYVIDKSVVLRSNTGKFIDFSRNDDGVIVTLFANYIFGQYFNYNIPSELSANVKVGGDYCVVYDKVNENLKIINYLEAKNENPLNVLIARFIYDGSRIIILYVASVLYTVDGISCNLLGNSKNIDIFSKKIDKVILQNRFNSINITTGNPNVLHVKGVSIKTIRDGAISMLPDQEVELTNSTFNFILLNITDGNIISAINQSDAEQYINSSGYYLIGTIYPVGNSEQGVYQLDCDFSINGVPYLLTSDESANKYDHLDSYPEKNFLVSGGNDYIYNQMFESGTIKNIRIKAQTSGQLILDIWRKIDDYMFEKINTLPAYNVQEGDNTIRVNISVSEPFYIGYNNSSTVLPLSVQQNVHTTRGLFYKNRDATGNFIFLHNSDCGIEIDVITLYPKNRKISYKQLDHIGDSITDFCDSIYPSFGYQLIGYDNYLVQKVDFKKKIKINGYSGYTMGKVDGQGSIQDKLSEIIVSDIYTIFLGTNDFSFGVQLGTLDDYKNKTNSNTFYGGYRVLIDYLYSLNTNAKIFLCTLTNRNFNGLNSWDSVNSVGKSFQDYNMAIKEIANYESIEIIDLTNKSGVTRRNLSETTMDGVHPNCNGYRGIGIAMYSSIQHYL